MNNNVKKRRLPNTNITTTPKVRRLLPYVLCNDVDEAPSRIKNNQFIVNAGPSFSFESIVDVNMTDSLQPYAGKGLGQHKNTSLLSQLPNELLSIIINHLLTTEQQTSLYQCTLVNRRFYNAANPLLWKVIHFDKDTLFIERFINAIGNIPTRRLATLGHHIRELQLYGAYWRDDDLRRLMPRMPLLQHLNIHFSAYVTSACFRQLPQHLQHLTSLQLTYAPFTPAFFHAVGQHCLRLRDLEWNIWDDQSPEWLEWLTSCPLERLVISCFRISLNSKALTQIKGFPHLTCLDINHMTPSPMVSLLSIGTHTTTTTAIARKRTTSFSSLPSLISTAPTMSWPQLTHVSLSPCDDLDDTTLIQFIKAHHPRLQKLHLMKASILTDVTLEALPTWMPLLTSLTLTRNELITQEAAERLISRSPHLKKARFLCCPRLSFDTNKANN